MREVKGDLWEYPSSVKVITTNGSIRKDGACVMGRGVALQAKRRWPELPMMLGGLLKAYGNLPFVIDMKDGILLVTFPVKHEWHEQADISLIYQGTLLIANTAKSSGWDEIALPRPGCGNGKLSWDTVKPVLESILDDKFVVVNNE